MEYKIHIECNNVLSYTQITDFCQANDIAFEGIFKANKQIAILVFAQQWVTRISELLRSLRLCEQHVPIHLYMEYESHYNSGTISLPDWVLKFVSEMKIKKLSVVYRITN
jgi:hypothetical protein